MRDDLKQLRLATGMNRKEFAEYFEIPYRTLQDWELGNREMPEYLFRLLSYYVRVNLQLMQQGMKHPEFDTGEEYQK